MSIIVFITGLLIGSFLNVCIYRIPLKESIAYPPSHCPHCKTGLKPIDLIPVLSFLFRNGKCRYCNKKISLQYPLVELLSGIVYVFLFAEFGLTMLFLKYAVLCSLLIVISFIDFKYHIIPDELIIFGMAAGVLSVALYWDIGYAINGILGLLLGGGIFLLIAVVTNGAMGGGDIKLMGILGFWFGWKLVLLLSILAFIISAAVSLVLLVLKIKRRKDYIPFGPFIAVASFIVLYKGTAILDWYIHLII